jgi:hypothetical protein
MCSSCYVARLDQIALALALAHPFLPFRIILSFRLQRISPSIPCRRVQRNTPSSTTTAPRFHPASYGPHPLASAILSSPFLPSSRPIVGVHNRPKSFSVMNLRADSFAETEKYTHTRFLFSARRRERFALEERFVVPSREVRISSFLLSSLTFPPL